MFCPKCGQNQNTDTVRYCTRCGFQLTSVSELLVADGVLPAPEGQDRKGISFYEQVRKRVGAKIIFVGLVLTPFLLLCSFAADSPIPLVMALAIFLLGAADIAYGQIFGGNMVIAKIGKTDQLKPADSSAVLSPTLGEPVPWIPVKGTAEIIQPPSVTESTTRLLELDDDGRIN